MRADRVKLPSRGEWIFVRARYHRANGKRRLEAVREAAADWDEGRPVGNWDYEHYANLKRAA